MSEKKNKGGRPPRYTEWLSEDGLTRIRGWCRDGLTDQQIAHNIGINAATLCEWKKRFPELDKALKETKEIVDRAVENALYQKALSGDTTAMIFWLKNRKMDKWRDKQNIEADVKGDYSIEIEVK